MIHFKKKWPLLGLLVYLFSFPAFGNSGINFIDANLEQVQSKASKEDKLFFIYFNADWCMPCKWMENNTFIDPTLVKYTAQYYIAIKANIATAEGRILKEKFDVESIPSILIFAASGKLIGRKSSSLDSKDMLLWLQSLNRPEHHINQTQPLNFALTNNALESPRPDIHFQRPSLIPDDSPTGLLSAIEEQPIETNTLTLASNNNFMPRSSLRYGIQLYDQSYLYEQAIKIVLHLEQKYTEPIKLIPAPNQMLSIVMGNFESTGKAQAFLNFLNRNDIIGEVVIIE